MAPCWCSGWQGCSMLLSAPRRPGNRLLHSSSRGDDAALIDNNGKWQNRWETRGGCAWNSPGASSHRPGALAPLTCHPCSTRIRACDSRSSLKRKMLWLSSPLTARKWCLSCTLRLHIRYPALSATLLLGISIRAICKSGQHLYPQMRKDHSYLKLRQDQITQHKNRRCRIT